MKTKYQKVDPREVKESMLRTYSGENYPYAKAFINAFEKFANQDLEKGFYGDGGTIIAPCKFDERVAIALRDKTKSGDYWWDFGAYQAEIKEEYERFSISLGYFPKYSKKSIEDVAGPSYSRKRIFKDWLKHPFDFQELYFLDYFPRGTSIRFKSQKHDNPISKCELYFSKSNDLGNVLDKYAEQIVNEFNILTFKNREKNQK